MVDEGHDLLHVTPGKNDVPIQYVVTYYLRLYSCMIMWPLNKLSCLWSQKDIGVRRFSTLVAIDWKPPKRG